MNPFAVFQQMAILFLMMLMGFLACKTGVMGKESEQCISRLVVNLTCPALILDSVTSSDRLENTGTLGIIFLTAAAYYLVLPLLSKALVRLPGFAPKRREENEAMLLYSNLGFMGIPVVSAVLGEGALLYLTVFMALFNVSFFSYGAVLLQGEGKGQFSLRRVVNPGTVSAVVAVGMYVCQLTLPPLLRESVSAVGGVTTPLAMLVIGSSLARQPLDGILREKSLIPLAALRLGVLPLLNLLIGRMLIPDQTLLCVLVLASAMPVATNVVMLRTEAGGDTSGVTKGVFLTTLLSVGTIPLVSLLLSWLGLC